MSDDGLKMLEPTQQQPEEPMQVAPPDKHDVVPGLRWYAVREEGRADDHPGHTVSNTPDVHGWNNESGVAGYGLTWPQALSIANLSSQVELLKEELALQSGMAKALQADVEHQRKCAMRYADERDLARAELERLQCAMQALAGTPDIGQKVSDRLRAALSQNAPGGPSYVAHLQLEIRNLRAERDAAAAEMSRLRKAMSKQAVEWEEQVDDKGQAWLMPSGCAATALRQLMDVDGEETMETVAARIVAAAAQDSAHWQTEAFRADVAKFGALLEAEQRRLEVGAP